jgi:N-acyl-D-aspartate/D-glutamate deacylase
MADILIKNGDVIDGTGAPAYRADLRIKAGVIAEIGPGLAPAGERVFDAAGCYVTPGFIESHTHFDGTAWWQNDLDPLPGNGATTIIMGNCGFTCAPISDDAAASAEMMKIFSFFEDIPIAPFRDKVKWDWRSWSEYKQSMTASVKLPANYAAYCGHVALRLAVMGLDAWERAATAAEISQMAALLEDALAAGALGLSSNLLDYDGQNRPIPSLNADDAEFAALIDVLARYPAATLQVIVDIFVRMSAPESVERLARLTEGKAIRVQWAGLPVLKFQQAMGITQKMQAIHERLGREGRDFWTGHAHRPPSAVASLNHSLVFAQSKCFVWHEVVQAETEAEKLALLRSPEWRARARIDLEENAIKQSPLADGEKLFFYNSDNGAGPINCTAADFARELGVSYSDAMAEWFIRNGLNSTVHFAPWPIDDEILIKLFHDPKAVGNISDAGAHGQMLCGGGENMLLFTKYVKEQGAISIEKAVHVLTAKLAGHFNLADRGEIKLGKKGDIVVFNLDEIGYRPMKKVFDVPDEHAKDGLTWRWTRDAAPMRLTLVNGTPTFEQGRFTGALPGEMLSPALA